MSDYNEEEINNNNSDYDDDYQPQEQQDDVSNHGNDADKEEEEEKGETKTESVETRGSDDERNAARNEPKRRLLRKTRSSSGDGRRHNNDVEDVPADDTANSDDKNALRRERDSPVSDVNATERQLESGDKYEGSETILQINGSPMKTQETPSSPSSAEKRRVQVRGKSLDEERAREAEHNKDDTIITNGKATYEETLKDSLNFLNNNKPSSSTTANSRKASRSKLLDSLMDKYLDQDYVNRSATLQRPGGGDSNAENEQSRRKTSADIVQMGKLEENLQDNRARKKKQPPPPVRNKPLPGSRTWDEPKETQRQKAREKQWPPKEPPKDIGAYVVESYGQTDPYTKRLIKDIQRAKREEEQRKQEEKRTEVVSANTQPVDILRDVFTSKPVKSAPGKLKPQVTLNTEKSWIQHEKKPIVYDNAPNEPDWMKLIRNRRWKSTVKARFPCKDTDKSEFDRRSTTPKNWKKLAKDKNALKMLGEIVGVGAEGKSEICLRLSSTR